LEEHEQTMAIKMNKMQQRQDWENVQLLNQVVFQAVIAINPTQVCTVVFDEVKDVFIYRLYRAADCSLFERQIPSTDVIKNCAPYLRQMIKNRHLKQIGERVAQHYMTNILVASVLDFYNIR
jgi:hypothetical protein